MLNLNCVICAELFTHSDDVHITHCGHMFHLLCLRQWMERSKSCPQCRNKCTDRNIFRVYFNMANLDVSRIDVGSLQEQLDNATLSMKMKEREVNKAEEQVKTLKEIQKKCMKTISGLETKLQRNDFVILSYAEQVKMMREEVKVVTELRNEVKSLKQQIEIMEGVSSILTGSNAEAEKLLKSEGDPKKLAVWVTTLKRELRHCETKRTDLRNMLKVVQKDLRKETELKKSHEERISQLESENYQLSEKLKSYEQPTTSAKSKSASCTGGNAISPRLSLLAPIIREDRRLTISPSIKENVKKIEDSSSPYLNIKSSSIGLVPLFKRHHEGAPGNDSSVTKTTTSRLATLKISPKKLPNSSASAARHTDVSEKLSIFKKPRLGLAAASASAASASLMKPLGPNFVFNGFGGSEKVDPFAQNSDDDDDDDAEHEARRARKVPSSTSSSSSTTGKITSTVPNALSLSSRLKSGGLRNFKVSK